MPNEIASQAGHWYEKDGEPRYTIIGANGKERNTTLRDARKHGLVPSVTTILKQIAKPGLEIWKQKQILYSSLTIPRIEDETDDDLVARILVDSREHGKQAMEKGTEIHKWLELSFQGEDIPKDFAPHVLETKKQVAELTGFITGDWDTEKSFASPLGYGGKLDLSNQKWVIDFKTKEFDEDAKVKDFIYPEMGMQLAAYDDGINDSGSRCANVFVSTTNPGLVKVYEWAQEELLRSFEMFIKLLEFWQIGKNIIL